MRGEDVTLLPEEMSLRASRTGSVVRGNDDNAAHRKSSISERVSSREISLSPSYGGRRSKLSLQETARSLREELGRRFSAEEEKNSAVIKRLEATVEELRSEVSAKDMTMELMRDRLRKIEAAVGELFSCDC